jgi:FkbM family methyltransferase
MNTVIYCGFNTGRGYKKINNEFKFDVCYGFEPISHIYKEASNTFKKDKRLELFQLALSDKAGKTDFFVYSSEASSSCKELDDKWIQYWKKRKGKLLEVTEKIEVTTVNLLTWLEERKIDDLLLLKTDLQGYDYMVLKTMKPMIDSKKIKFIECEVENNSLEYSSYKETSNKYEMFKTLLDDNYEQIEGPKTQKEWNKLNTTHYDIRWKLK